MKQPKALYLLNFVSMWECFSYYGMRVLMVLFMIQVLQFDDSKAFLVYALYTTFVDLFGVIGGIAADRFLGLRRSIAVGGWIIALGHVCLALPDSKAAFFLGLGMIITGTALFRSNAATLLGQYYQEKDPRREAGYTLYYTGVNIGGFLATALCGIVGEIYGWHAGFGLAAAGMLLGNIALILGKNVLEGKGMRPIPPSSKQTVMELGGLALAMPTIALALYYVEFMMPFIPFIILGGVYYAFMQMKHIAPAQKTGIYRLALYVFFLIIFYACEEQLGSSLVLFSERHVDRQTAFGIIPAASLIMFNPLTILVTGPLLARVLQKLPVLEINMIGISFFLLASAFGLLYVGCLSAGADGIVPLAYVVVSFMVLALGELFIGPTVYTCASEVAPKGLQGLIMGIVMMGYSLANLFSGVISQTMAVAGTGSSVDMYSRSFGMIGLFTLVLGLGIAASTQSKISIKKMLS